MKKQIALWISLTGLLSLVIGCNETHAQKKKAMIEHWEKTTSAAQLPVIENLIEQGQIKKAKGELIECINANPDLADAYVLFGRIHFIEAHNDLAHQAFQHALELDSGLDQAWNYMGSLAVLEKDYELAAEHFQKAFDLAPSNIDYIISLSEIYVETGRIDEAIQLLEQGLSREPKNLELLLSKAHVYQRKDEVEESVRIYEQAQLMHGDDPRILEPCGFAYTTLGQWDKAAEKFGRLLDQYKENEERYHVTMRSLATCLFHSGQYGQSLYWYDKLSVINRDDADVWLNMAHASLSLDNGKRASYCAMNALKARPSWNKAYAVLGSANYMQGLYQQALQAYYKICDDEELGAFAWFMTGRCYQQMGQNRQANSAFERAEKLDTENELISTFLKKTIHPL